MRSTQCLNSSIQNISVADGVDIDLAVPDSSVNSESYNGVDQRFGQSLHNVLTIREFLEDEPRTPSHDILDEVRGIAEESKLFNVLNSSFPFDAQSQEDDVSSDFLFGLYEKFRDNFKTSGSLEGDELNCTKRSNDSTVNSNLLREMLSRIMCVTDDDMLSGLLQQVPERGKELEK